MNRTYRGWTIITQPCDAEGRFADICSCENMSDWAYAPYAIRPETWLSIYKEVGFTKSPGPVSSTCRRHVDPALNTSPYDTVESVIDLLANYIVNGRTDLVCPDCGDVQTIHNPRGMIGGKEW